MFTRDSLAGPGQVGVEDVSPAEPSKKSVLNIAKVQDILPEINDGPQLPVLMGV